MTPPRTPRPEPVCRHLAGTTSRTPEPTSRPLTNALPPDNRRNGFTGKRCSSVYLAVSA